MKVLHVLIALIVCEGCMSQKKIDNTLAELPPYMHQNIGAVEYKPLSPFSPYLAGVFVTISDNKVTTLRKE